jgi:hypothetical protein
MRLFRYCRGIAFMVFQKLNVQRFDMRMVMSPILNPMVGANWKSCGGGGGDDGGGGTEDVVVNGEDTMYLLLYLYNAST